VLVKFLMEGAVLDYVLHKQCVRKVGAEAMKERCEEEKAFIKSLMERAPKAAKKRLEKMGETGAWLTVTPVCLHGTIISADEWQDNARLRVGLRPHRLCERCDG